jgi:hypothetical protein
MVWGGSGEEIIKLLSEPWIGIATGAFEEALVVTSWDNDSCVTKELCGIAESCPVWQQR